MKVGVLVLFCFVIACKGQLYVSSVNGVDNSTCTTQMPCKTIQEAINVFNANPQTILSIIIDDGTYSGPNNVGITFPDVEVIIQGQDTVFDCGDIKNSLGFTANNELTLTNITLLHCKLPLNISSELTMSFVNVIASTGNYSDISIKHSPSITIDNSVFNNTIIESEGAITSVDISASYFENSLLELTSEKFSIIDCTFNNLEYPNALYAYDFDSTGIIENTKIMNFESGGIFIEGGYWRISNFVAMDGNEAGLIFSASGIISDSSISNTRNTLTCGMMITRATMVSATPNFVSITNSIFENCQTTSLSDISGGLCAIDFAVLEIENTIFRNNIAIGNGGGMSISASNYKCHITNFVNVTFSNNTASSGAAIACGTSHLYGCDNGIQTPSADSIILINNTNTDPTGQDISCDVSIEQNLYFSPNGTDNLVCSLSSPCNSIQSIENVYNNNTNGLNIKIYPGVYEGSSNSNIELPSIPVTIEKILSESSYEIDDNVVITCNDMNNFGFKAISNLTVTGITIENCGTGIDFSGNTFNIVDSVINNATIGISIQNEITIVAVDTITFTQCSSSSILFKPTSIVQYFDISYCDFINTAGIELTLNNDDFYAYISGDFTNITSPVAITLNGGNWNLINVDISGFDTSIEYIGTSSDNNILDIDRCFFQNGNTGIIFNANGLFQLEETSIENVKLAVNSTVSNSIIFDEVTVNNAIVVGELYVDEINIGDSSFSNSGSLILTGTNSTSTKVIDNCDFRYSNDTALIINSFSSWTVSNSNFLNCYSTLNGGGLVINGAGDDIAVESCYFNSNSAANNGGSFYFNDITLNSNGNEFSESSSINGGCVYSSGSTIIMTATTFSDCDATQNGGGMYANALGIQMTSSSFNDCSAGSDGGALFLENNSTTLVTAFTNTDFIGNTAVVGGEIACCSSNCDVEITVVSPGNETNNISTGGGPAISCNQDNTNNNNNNGDTDGDDDDSIDKKIAIGVGIIILIACIVAVCIPLGYYGYSTYKKNKSYEKLSDTF